MADGIDTAAATGREAELEAEIVRLEAEVAHWKANHAEMVARNAVLRDRPDLPADRLPAMARLDELLRQVVMNSPADR